MAPSDARCEPRAVCAGSLRSRLRAVHGLVVAGRRFAGAGRKLPTAPCASQDFVAQTLSTEVSWRDSLTDGNGISRIVRRDTLSPVTTLPMGTALGLLMVALLGTGGAIGVYSVSNGGMGGMMSGNHMAQCGAMNAECGRQHASCVQDMQNGTHTECEAMGMSPEQCQAMHSQPGAMTSGSCH